MKNIGKKLVVLVLFILLIVYMVSVSACNSGKDLAGTDADLMKDITVHTVEKGNIDAEFSKSVTHFSIELLQQCSQKEENSLVCPISSYTLLSNLANGTNGNTQKQILDALNGGMDVEQLNQSINFFSDSLKSADQSLFMMSNSIWLNKDIIKGLTLKTQFLQTSADYYHSAAFSIPFNMSACNSMNQWVNKNTDGLVDHIVNNDDMDNVLIMLNTALFDSKWQNEYKSTDEKKDDFYKEDGKKVSATFMHHLESRYLTGQNFVGFEKPYKGEKYSFVALLPDENVDIHSFIKSMNAEELISVLQTVDQVDEVEREHVNAYLPKFSFSDNIDMIDALMQLGITDLFDSAQCDLSPMFQPVQQGLFVSKIKQKTNISVNEKGTKAGAVSSAEVTKSASTQAAIVKLNRPFVFAIVDNTTKIPLFTGCIMDPSK